jgi:hypothetical protein
MADMTETLGRAGLTLGEALAGEADLDRLRAALVRETVIRQVMADSGEDRRTVTDMLDAMRSMADEAVLDLMDGEPTTLHAGLQRYVDELEKRDELQPRDRVVDDLSTLLAYPWPVATGGPGQELEVERPDDETVIVKVGGQLVAGANHDDHGWAGMDLLETTARNVHRAVIEAAQRA